MPVAGISAEGTRLFPHNYETTEMSSIGVNTCSGGQCTACQGDCDADSDCVEGLKCYQNTGNENWYDELIPGCIGDDNVVGWDYCYDPNLSPKRGKYYFSVDTS